MEQAKMRLICRKNREIATRLPDVSQYLDFVYTLFSVTGGRNET